MRERNQTTPRQTVPAGSNTSLSKTPRFAVKGKGRSAEHRWSSICIIVVVAGADQEGGEANMLAPGGGGGGGGPMPSECEYKSKCNLINNSLTNF